MAQGIQDDIQYCGFNIYKNFKTGETFFKNGTGGLEKKSSLISEAEARFVKRHLKKEALENESIR